MCARACVCVCTLLRGERATHLLLALIVANGEAVADFDLTAVFAAHAEERPDDSVLVGVPSQRVVEDREKRLRAVQISKLPNLCGQTERGGY